MSSQTSGSKALDSLGIRNQSFGRFLLLWSYTKFQCLFLFLDLFTARTRRSEPLIPKDSGRKSEMNWYLNAIKDGVDSEVNLKSEIRFSVEA